MLHIEHDLVTRHGKAWCGQDLTGPRITGFDSFLYYRDDTDVCEACIQAVISRVVEKAEVLAQLAERKP